MSVILCTRVYKFVHIIYRNLPKAVWYSYRYMSSFIDVYARVYVNNTRLPSMVSRRKYSCLPRDFEIEGLSKTEECIGFINKCRNLKLKENRKGLE